MIIGQILKPHGLKGFLKIFLYSNDFDYKFVTVNDVKLEIESIKTNPKPIIKFFNYDSIESVNSLIKAYIHIEKEELPNNEIYWDDLVGMQILSPDGEKISKVLQVHDFGAGLVLDTDLDHMIAWSQISKLDKENSILILKQWPL